MITKPLSEEKLLEPSFSGEDFEADSFEFLIKEGEVLKKNLKFSGTGRGKIFGKIMLMKGANLELNLQIGKVLKGEEMNLDLKAVLQEGATILARVLFDSPESGANIGQSLAFLKLGSAKVVAIPELFIEGKGVAAKHAVWIRSISGTDLAYLQKSGLDLKEAKEMIAQGFLAYE